MAYLLNIILVPLYYLLIKDICKNRGQAHKLFAWVVSVHAILFRALACPYNYPDTAGYAEAFEDIATMSFKEAVLTPNLYSSWGHGFIFLNWMINRFTTDVNWNFIVISIISVSGIIWYYKNTSYALLTTLLFYFLHPMLYIMGFGVLRQHLSMVFLLSALYFIERKKLSIAFAIAGTLFHVSVLIFFPFYLLKDINLRKINVVKLLILTISLFLLFRSVIGYVVSFLPDYYQESSKEVGESNTLPFIVMLSVIIMYFYTGVYHRLSPKRDKYLANFMIYGFIITLFCIGLPGGGRLSLCFIYALPVAITQLMKYSNPKMSVVNKLYIGMLFLLCFTLIYFSYSSGNAATRYDFIWEKI